MVEYVRVRGNRSIFNQGLKSKLNDDNISNSFADSSANEWRVQIRKTQQTDTHYHC